MQSQGSRRVFLLAPRCQHCRAAQAVLSLPPGARLDCALAADLGLLCRWSLAGGFHCLWLPFKGQSFQK